MSYSVKQRIQSGFTLIEAIVVIVATAVIVGFIALFLRKPFQQYLDLSVRAEMTDTANTAVRRISRELHLAIPNSVRSASSSCIEFIPSYDGGRYRSAADGSGAGNVFTTTQAITNFDVIGPLVSAPAVGDFVVVYNLGIPGADAYAPSDNRVAIVAPTSTTTINFASKQFLYDSPGKKFSLVSGTERAVSYVCSGVGIDAKGNGTGKLYRVSGYGFNYPEPTTCANTAGASIIAQNLKSCQFTYTTGVRERSGLVAVRLSLARSVSELSESVSLYHDINVNNVP